MSRKFLRFTGNVIKYGCVTHCTFEYLGDFVVCNGPSMEPTLYSNDILLTERISPRFSKTSKGDIIIAKCPTNPNLFICKHVTGVAGDKISFDKSNPSDEKTVEVDHDSEGHKKRSNSEGESVVTYVPKGHVWLEGDNLLNSMDSRSYGPVPEGLIKSRVICRIWPHDKIKMLN